MSSIVFNPSTQQPDSVSVKTGTYTIPTGFYAYVTASVQDTDTFSIGGVVALSATGNVTQSLTTGAVSAVSQSALNSTSYTVPSGYYFQGQATSDSLPAIAIGGLNVGRGTVYTSTSPSTFFAGSGDAVLVSNTGNTCILTGVSIRPFSITTMGLPASAVSGSFWVSSGTILTTTTGSYTVSLYRNIA